MNVKKTKIVCTIGPASSDNIILKNLIKSGMNVARLNFSHGDYDSHKNLIKKIRKVAEELNSNIAIIQDLQGPRIRVAKISSKGLDLIKNEKVIIAFKKYLENINIKGLDNKIIPLDYKYIAEDVKLKDNILINDGLIEIKVIKVINNLVYGKVIKGGLIFSHKGINIPGVKIKENVITKKDKKDLLFGIKNKIDFVAISFVENYKNIIELKKLIKKYKPKNEIKVIAKIERMSAFIDRKNIIDYADGIMIARGDLGIEIPDAKVPIVQKELISNCLEVGKPVIVATQMLDSMINSAKPTRAEVSDVANAVIDGTDAVMLSGETAFGKYPVETVKMMSDIILETEKSSYDFTGNPIKVNNEDKNINNKDMICAITDSVFHLVQRLNAKHIVVATQSGFTARMVSRYRPGVTIMVMVADEQVSRHLALVWGVYTFKIKYCKNFDEIINESINKLKLEKLVKINDKLVFITGQPISSAQSMNLIKLHTVK